MARVFVSVGSNIEREHHIVMALDAMQEQFSALQVSSVYESEAVGFAGDHFFNLVAGFETGMAVGELSVCLRQIEKQNGRNRSTERFSARTLDIDILTYDDRTGLCDGILLPRPEILENAFVLLPLAEIAPSEQHPVEHKTYADLWRAYARKQNLWPVDFIWRGQKISSRASV